MKAIKVNLSRDLKNLEIITFADLHLGDVHCDVDLIRKDIEYVKDNRNVYCILNGDILNNSTKNSVGDVYSETLTPMDQLQRAVALFEPIKNKILAVTTGNHEARTWRNDGIDLMSLMCTQLGISERYANESGLIFLRFGAVTNGHKETNGSGKSRMVSYTIFVTHGSGGGRKEGAKAIRLADMSSIVDADIYIHSHTHLPMIMKESFYRTDIQNSVVAMVDKLFVNTSARLNYGGYGEALEFKPSSKDNPHIYLNGTKKQFVARL